jgi:hypothetical protein
MVAWPALAAEEGRSAHFDAGLYARHVNYLASEECEGRGPGSAGIEKAAGYIAEQFASVGLAPAGDEGTYFQEFQVTLGKKATDKTALKLLPEGPDFTAHEDFVPLPFSTAGDFEGPVAFVGYGITADEFDYDDYGDFGVKGKVLLMLRFEPEARNDTDFDGPDKHSDYALFSTKAKLARKKGAAGILVVNPQSDDDQADTLYAVTGGGGMMDFHIPMLHVKRSVAERILQAGGLPSLSELQRKLDKDREPQTQDLPGVRIAGDSGLVKKSVPTRNIVGVLPGSGDLADEYVVIGAHYDHLGRTTLQFPSAKRKADPDATYTHYGADDNASGTAGVLELARALSNGAPGPRRSILFISFSGEEMGLLGSEHYVSHPTVPVDKMVAMLNLDMIGRMKEDKLTVSGVKTSGVFEELLPRMAEERGFRLSTTASGFGASDQTSFYTKRMPVLHFFTGLHKDYHRPSDTADKIDAAGAVRVLELVADLADTIARAPERPDYQKVKMESRGERAALKVRMGIMPGFGEDDEDGMAVTGVIEDGPADHAGMKDGDRIISIGETPVNNIYDYMDALSEFEPGQDVVVRIMRDGQRISLQVKLSASKR